ncbi:hypothetical protein PDE_03924 [Penicillium oxalicum 114-2]|uniref:Uncharacterized protein n=1 Tax=Penicillium oxalicum (strain 114-2 / CGMCC 5302) TaxID=933388 RepID=S8ASD9_PENO1|nr:hypothetical protein PDE_03924 [Penicillium oxalicum 114-2]
MVQDIAMWFSDSRRSWSSVASTDEEADKQDLINYHGPEPQEARRHKRSSTRCWILSTGLFACISGVLLTLLLSKDRFALDPTCKPWRDTDLQVALQNLQDRKVSFSGGLAYDDVGHLIIESKPGDRKWIGDPTPEMDALWDHVAYGSIVLLEGSEAASVRDKTVLYDGYWLTGLDVIHQMHCLNMIRKTFYPEYYQLKPAVGAERLHLEHCFDYVRQAVMCNSDVTPVPLTWYPSSKKFGPDFRTTHMCRDFEGLLNWSIERNSTARKKKGTGGEYTKNPWMVMPGSLSESAGLSHGEHHHGH